MKNEIKQFNKDAVRRLLRPALELALQDVEHAFTLKGQVGRIRFTPTTMSVTIDLAVFGEGARQKPPSDKRSGSWPAATGSTRMRSTWSSSFKVRNSPSPD